MAVGFSGWTTYGYDPRHDGFNPNTTAITPSSIASLHLAWQMNYNDYNTQTEPVLAPNVGGHRGLLFVGGASGKLVAVDATTGTIAWSRPLGQTQFTCGGGSPNFFGIGGTVAYDPQSQTIYVPANTNATVNAPAQTSIVRLAAASGEIVSRIDVGANPLAGELDFAHTAVTLANGRAYIGTSSTCDVSSWRGRVAVTDANVANMRPFYTVWTSSAPYSGGGVWGWGGVSVDDAGAVYAGVGNADTNAGTGGPQPPFVQSTNEAVGLGDRLIKISGDLSTLLASHQPGSGGTGDLDLSGSPILYTPVMCKDALASIQGKAGQLLTYDAKAIANGPISRLQISPTTSDAPFLGNPGYSPVTGLLYEPVETSSAGIAAPGLLAYRPMGCDTSTSLALAWRAAFGPDSYAGGGIESRSAPSITAGGVAFVGTPCNADGTGGCMSTISGRVGGALWAIDASNGTVLNGGKPLVISGAPIRMAPVVDGGWVFFTDNGSDLYGMTIDPSVPARAPQYRAPMQSTTLSRRQRF